MALVRRLLVEPLPAKRAEHPDFNGEIPRCAYIGLDDLRFPTGDTFSPGPY